MNKKITEKIKEILTPEDLEAFEGAVESLISERTALVEEELKNKYDEIAEEYVQKRLAEEIEKEKASLVESYDQKLSALEKKVVNKLDSFMDHVITEQISDETIEKIAINETLQPIVNGIKKLYEDNHIAIDADGSNVIKEKEEKISDLEKKLSESIAKGMETEERLEKTAVFLLISEKTEGMVKSQKDRVVKMFRDKPFEEVEDKIETFIEMVKESREKPIKENKETKKIDEILTEDDGTVEEKPVIQEEADEAPSTAVRANAFL